MALAELFESVPALSRLEELSRGFIRRQLVEVAVQDETLTLSWLQNGERQWRGVDLPVDLCRDGLPMQRQALGELCADLLLDCGLSPAAVDLELLLPLEACQWRLLAGSDGGARRRAPRETSPPAFVFSTSPRRARAARTRATTQARTRGRPREPWGTPPRG